MQQNLPKNDQMPDTQQTLEHIDARIAEVEMDVKRIERDVGDIRRDMPKRISATWMFTTVLCVLALATGAIWWASEINTKMFTLTASVQQISVSLDKLSEIGMLRTRFNILEREVERLREERRR